MRMPVIFVGHGYLSEAFLEDSMLERSPVVRHDTAVLKIELRRVS
jgi:hypothetical protein